MKKRVFIGVDLGTSTVRKSTGIAYLVEKDEKLWMERAPIHIKSEDNIIHSFLIEICEKFSSCIVAIDAPLSLPEHNMRECEIRLRKHGIACYPSGAWWVSKWVNKGIELKNWAEEKLGAKVIEAYPYGARRALDIGAQVKKKSKQGREEIQSGLLKLIHGMNEIGNLLSVDELDALLAAYTAYCEGKGDAIIMDGSDGVIYLPSKPCCEKRRLTGKLSIFDITTSCHALLSLSPHLS